MFRTILRSAVRRSLAEVRHVRPVGHGEARGTLAVLYRQVEEDFGLLAPPVALHSPDPGCAAAAWVMLRESLLVPGRTDRSEREAVATAVSLGNTCPYCVDVHGATLGELSGRAGAPADAGAWLDSLPSGAVRRAAEWALPDAPGVPARGGAELGAVALTFHYLNRMVNVFLGDSPLPRHAPGVVRTRIHRSMGSLLGASGGVPLVPGTSLDLLPEVGGEEDPPVDLAWASGEPRLARALARAFSTIEAAGADSVPESVRVMVRGRLRDSATAQGPGLSWVEDAVSSLGASERALGRLALLTALSSHQVGEGAVASCRDAGADDRLLVRTASWAAMTAARHATGRMFDGVRRPPSPTDMERNQT